MPIHVLSSNIKKEDKEFINSIFKGVIDREPDGIDDLECIEPSYSGSGIIIVVMGKKAERYMKDSCLSVVSIPHHSKLYKKPENFEHRKKAWDVLSSLNKAVPLSDSKPNEISLDQIPDWILQQTNNIEQVFKDKGISSWECVGSDGTKILISVAPKQTDRLNITVSELLLIKSLKDTFGIKKIKQV